MSGTLLLDVLIVLLTATVLVVLITRGGVFELAGVRVRLRSVDNPIWMLTVLVLARVSLRHTAFLGVRRWDLSRGLTGLEAIERRMSAASGRTIARWLVAIGVAAFAIKAACASFLPGYFSGDDVEIHEMTFAALFRRDWPIWELRNAFFPMGFIYPAQKLAHLAGAADPEHLVFAGRLVVALLSTAVIPLTWLAAKQLTGGSSPVPLLAAVLVAVNKLQMSFGSSELPRPVSSVFVLAAFLALARPAPRAVAAGMLVGIATVFRFSEAVFVIPAALLLLGQRMWTRTAVFLFTWASSAALILAITDYLYWGQPFFSVINAVDYTIVKRLSSRGHEPVWQYLMLVSDWTTWTVFALAAIGSRLSRPVALWLWVPVVCLSLLPHKEARYLIPVIPFLSIAAAMGFWRIVEICGRVRHTRRGAAAGFAVLPLLLLSVLHDAGGWRLGRSNDDVTLARYIRAQGRGGVAVEQSWRVGGRPHLPDQEPFVELDDARLADAASRFQAFKDVRWIAVRSGTAARLDDAELAAHGFHRDNRWRAGNYVLFAR